ncbi:phosphoribosylglycinamide formyltransferase [Salinicoccus kekensis]|uniref:Phosphoribosylglycinamide formyltransferase n=1 Tax=Salinicoccus kekensis TaxID=714307 RepID=A0A285U8W5_9STAP|nr:phosphoribosylglycinamide formyltransferase [Salinicoccus kekensis]SOC37828.1 formyltetrahydrofolate-dependent phosphoribosylglycinamide formyltransferase [Salinicoccus kekensis]
MTKPRVAVFASGGGTNFENLVRKQEEIGIDIVLLISDYNEAYAIQRAINHDVDYIVVEREKYATKAEFESDILSVMRMYNIEYILLAGFMRILSADFVGRYPRKIINIHPSLLPDFKGADAIGDAFRAGVRETGVTVHFVDAGIDTGEIIAQVPVDVAPEDTLEELENKVHSIEYQLYPQAVRMILAKRQEDEQ